ncbi:unnamed protein product [Schistocephalus solidus]|uniref:Uncharacterized protein n=1 Tax=Schistocephalus solidus TaxID=70667 RepID=A0A183SE99_SCHSO|nr:unnamed protein product [Schistocephalus solidus]
MRDHGERTKTTPDIYLEMASLWYRPTVAVGFMKRGLVKVSPRGGGGGGGDGGGGSVDPISVVVIAIAAAATTPTHIVNYKGSADVPTAEQMGGTTGTDFVLHCPTQERGS